MYTVHPQAILVMSHFVLFHLNAYLVTYNRKCCDLSTKDFRADRMTSPKQVYVSVSVCVCVFSRHEAAICKFTHSRHPVDPRYPIARIVNLRHFRVSRPFFTQNTLVSSKFWSDRFLSHFTQVKQNFIHTVCVCREKRRLLSL